MALENYFIKQINYKTAMSSNEFIANKNCGFIWG